MNEYWCIHEKRVILIAKKWMLPWTWWIQLCSPTWITWSSVKKFRCLIHCRSALHKSNFLINVVTMIVITFRMYNVVLVWGYLSGGAYLAVLVWRCIFVAHLKCWLGDLLIFDKSYNGEATKVVGDGVY